MRFFYNLNRLDELLDEEKVKKAARTLLGLPTVPVLKAIAAVWTVLLVLIFTLLLTIRVAISLPLW